MVRQVRPSHLYVSRAHSLQALTIQFGSRAGSVGGTHFCSFVFSPDSCTAAAAPSGIRHQACHAFCGAACRTRLLLLARASIVGAGRGASVYGPRRSARSRISSASRSSMVSRLRMPGLAVGHEHRGRPRHRVVVRAIAACTRRSPEPRAGRRASALAAAGRGSARRPTRSACRRRVRARRRLVGAVGQQPRVARAVELRPRVVGHAAVDRDVRRARRSPASRRRPRRA